MDAAPTTTTKSLFDTLRETLASLRRKLVSGERRAVRDRMELAVAVAVSACAVVTAAVFLHPDPKRLYGELSESSTKQVRARTRDTLVRFYAGHGENKGRATFVAAVRAGDVATMERHFHDGLLLYGMLAIAVEGGHDEAVEWLIAHGANVAEGEGGTEALPLLADRHPRILARLRAHGAPEPTELVVAALSGAENAVKRLLASSTDPGEQGRSLALVLTADRPDFQTKTRIVDALLGAGAPPARPAGLDSFDADPLAAAITACERSRAPKPSLAECFALVNRFLAREIPISGEAIAAAADLSSPEMRDVFLEVLLAGRLDRDAPSIALASATKLTPAFVKAMVSRGVDWGFSEDDTGAWMPLISAIRRADREGVRLLLDAGAPIARHYKSGTSALAEAIDTLSRGSDAESILEMLVARGADVNRRLPDGRTPLFAAAEAGNLRAVTLLLDKGARVNERVLDDTALDAAERSDSISVARVIHARGGRRGPQNRFFQ